MSQKNVSVPLVGSETVSNFENKEDDKIGIGMIANKSAENRERRLEVIRDSFMIKSLEDEIDKVLTIRTEMKNRKQRIERLKAVLALLSREDAVVEFEYVDKDEAQKPKTIKTNYKRKN